MKNLNQVYFPANQLQIFRTSSYFIGIPQEGLSSDSESESAGSDEDEEEEEESENEGEKEEAKSNKEEQKETSPAKLDFKLPKEDKSTCFTFKIFQKKSQKRSWIWK